MKHSDVVTFSLSLSLSLFFFFFYVVHGIHGSIPIFFG